MPSVAFHETNLTKNHLFNHQILFIILATHNPTTLTADRSLHYPSTQLGPNECETL